MEKSQRSLTLDNELHATKDCWERTSIPQRWNSPIGCPMPTDQPWNYNYISMKLYNYNFICIQKIYM